MSNDLKEKLQDATAAFTFSRLPREQRIAQTLFQILQKDGAQMRTDSYESLDDVLVDSQLNLVEIATELAHYSVKDFAVRYGHLADGKA